MSVPLPHPARRRARTSADVDELFGRQRTSTRDLPDPRPLLEGLSRGVLEVLAGVREVEQLARWLDEEPYRSLLTRSNLAKRSRSARRQPARHPSYAIRSIRSTEPADGVVEAVVVVTMPGRTRAIAMRLEGMDRRWRATSLAVL